MHSIISNKQSLKINVVLRKHLIRKIFLVHKVFKTNHLVCEEITAITTKEQCIESRAKNNKMLT